MPTNGPIYRELWRHRHATLAQIYYWDTKRRRYGCLSDPAKLVIKGAAQSVTGMLFGPNEYWLPDVMSEAIEAAEELGL